MGRISLKCGQSAPVPGRRITPDHQPIKTTQEVALQRNEKNAGEPPALQIPSTLNSQPSILLSTLRAFSRLDEFPELGIFLEGLIFGDLDARAKEEILERMPTQDAMHQDAKLVALEINPVITHAEAVQDVAVAFQLAEIIKFAADDMLGQAAKVAQNLELQFLGHARQLGGTGGRENDLKRVHASAHPIYLANRREATLINDLADLGSKGARIVPIRSAWRILGGTAYPHAA